MLRDRLLERIAQMGDAPDYQRLAADVLGIRGATPELARRLVEQALVVEERRTEWRRAGERICREAPPTPGVYVLKDADDHALYVGKAVNLRRRLRAHFAERRWRAIKPGMARAADADWRQVGSELEALLREAELIDELNPPGNVQIGEPALETRAVPTAIARDVVVLLPSVEPGSVELVAAAADGRWMIQRSRRSGADLPVHAQRVMRFFHGALRRRGSFETPRLAPIVFSWLAQRGASATHLDPHDVRDARDLRRRLTALFRDAQLFNGRLQQC
jgi:predicted GIY-YIG superfamily endonuclease